MTPRAHARGAHGGLAKKATRERRDRAFPRILFFGWAGLSLPFRAGFWPRAPPL